MAKFRILVTDLTEYGEKLRCVAGWDLDQNKMIRPEPRPGGFWDRAVCGTGQPFNIANIVVFEAAPPNPPTQLPHLNEDRVVEGGIAVEKSLSREEFIAALKQIPTVSGSVAFAAPVQARNAKAFVPTGTNHPSLRGLFVKSSEITFTTQKFGDGPAKARCLVTVPKSPTINLSIAACDLRAVFRKSGREGLKNLFINSNALHVRLGLARGFGDYPDRCYMQVNGIFRL